MIVFVNNFLLLLQRKHDTKSKSSVLTLQINNSTNAVYSCFKLKFPIPAPFRLP